MTAQIPDMKPISLSDGRVATFTRKPKAGDASKAFRIAGAKGNDIDRSAALIAQIVTIDGQAVVQEDLLNLDLDDFNAIAEAMPGKPPTPETSN